jgi:hypothetical protein
MSNSRQKKSQVIMHTVSNYLEEIGVAHATDSDSASLQFQIETPMGDAPCFFICNKEAGIAIYSCLPVEVPRGKLSEVALYLCCLNNNRFWGCFEMDLKTRNVYFRTYLEFENQTLSIQKIERSMSENLAVMQEHLTGLIDLILN